MVNQILSYRELYSALSSYKKLSDKAIITFILSTGIKSDKLVELKLKDLLKACGKDIDDDNSLKELLDENPLEIMPCWVCYDESGSKVVFNSYEASFYLFLYLKDRFSNIESYDEYLFAPNNNNDNNDWPKYKASTIRGRITSINGCSNIRQTSLIRTFENICENFVNDTEVKELFLGKSTRYNDENELYDVLNDELYKEKLINEYNKLIPRLTAGNYMYEHLKNYVSTITDETNYQQVIENYYRNNFNPRFEKRFDEMNFGKMLYYAYDVAREDIENGTYEETYSYFDKILTQAEIFVIFQKTETRLGSDRYRTFDYGNIGPTNPHIRKDMVINCIEEMNIRDRLNLSPEEMEREVIRQLGLHDCLLENFNYELFQKVLFDTIYARLEANNIY